MDPLTALGLASNVVSFVSFASELFKTSREVYSSATGSTENVVLLERVYSNLGSLSTKLQSTCEYRLVHDLSHVSLRDAVTDAAVSVKILAESCKRDCDQLLVVTESLRLNDSSASRRKWESFRIALRRVWEQKKIDEIEDRLLKTQVTLTLHIGTISGSFSKRHYELYRTLDARSKEMQLEQHEGLREIKASLGSLNYIVQESLTNKSKPIDSGDVELLDHKFKQLSLVQDLLNKEQRFLSTLQFDARPLRHEAISKAHENTFRWLLDSDLGDKCGSKATKCEGSPQDKMTLTQWLATKSGIFWVTGKPGSGKSTLMKFIAGEPKTKSILSRWASPVVVAAHYFWNSGSAMQRSQEGLLRTLLYEIFRQCTKLIPLVCAEQWCQLDHSNDTLGFWSLSSLSEALSRISEKNVEIQQNFCFFVDGLDEFEGDHDGQFQLCQTMCKLSRSPHIKVCLSSRPWNVFEEAFGEKPKIYVHDLTRNDIRNYAVSRLQEHPKWPQITGPLTDQVLIDKIANRSSGVFLWVVLVTKLLREGMTNRDRIPDLVRRLDSFPCELEDFFKQILNSVEPIYHAKTATLLQIALAAKEPLHMVIYDFHDLEHDEEDYFVSIPRLPFTIEDEPEIYSRTVCHLNSRTRGLLEISSPSAPVTFLHRTVKDYLATRPIQDFLQQNTRKSPRLKFIPELSILRAYAAWMKRAKPQVYERNHWASYSALRSAVSWSTIEQSIRELTERMMPYAAQIDVERHLDWSLAKILDEIDRNVSIMLLAERRCNGLTKHCAWNTKLFFREHLAEGSVKRYLLAKEAKDPIISSNDWNASLGEFLEDPKPKSLSGIGAVVTRSSATKGRKPRIGSRITPKASERSKNSPERERPVKRRRQV